MYVTRIPFMFSQEVVGIVRVIALTRTDYGSMVELIILVDEDVQEKHTLIVETVYENCSFLGGDFLGMVDSLFYFWRIE